MNRWGIFGVFFLLFSSSMRMAYLSSYIFYVNVHSEYWITYTCTCLLFLFGEGRAIHKKFTPYVIKKSKELTSESSKLINLLAPFYCMGFFEKNKKAWISTCLIIAMSIGVGYLPFLCKMAIDAGVALALSVGSVSLLVRYFREKDVSDT